MRCFSYSFRDEDELEDLLVDLWLRLEEVQIEAPQLEIRRSGGSTGVLLLWLTTDPLLATLLPAPKDTLTLRPASVGRHEERESLVRRTHCTPGARPRWGGKSSPAKIGGWHAQEGGRQARECAILRQEQRCGAPSELGGGRRGVRHLRGRRRP